MRRTGVLLGSGLSPSGNSWGLLEGSKVDRQITNKDAGKSSQPTQKTHIVSTESLLVDHTSTFALLRLRLSLSNRASALQCFSRLTYVALQLGFSVHIAPESHLAGHVRLLCCRSAAHAQLRWCGLAIKLAHPTCGQASFGHRWSA